MGDCRLRLRRGGGWAHSPPQQLALSDCSLQQERGRRRCRVVSCMYGGTAGCQLRVSYALSRNLWLDRYMC